MLTTRSYAVRDDWDAMAETRAAGAASAASPGRDAAQAPVPDAYARSGEAVAQALGVERSAGLSSEVVAQRALEAGSNELEPAPRTALPKLLLEAATEPFVLLLIAAGVLAVAPG